MHGKTSGRIICSEGLPGNRFRIVASKEESSDGCHMWPVDFGATSRFCAVAPKYAGNSLFQRRRAAGLPGQPGQRTAFDPATSLEQSFDDSRIVCSRWRIAVDDGPERLAKSRAIVGIFDFERSASPQEQSDGF